MNLFSSKPIISEFIATKSFASANRFVAEQYPMTSNFIATKSCANAQRFVANTKNNSEFIATKYTESNLPIENDNQVLQQQTRNRLVSKEQEKKKELNRFRSSIKDKKEEQKKEEKQKYIDKHKEIKPTIMPTSLKEAEKRKRVLKKDRMSPLV